jgi:hypothetical protein
MLCIPTARVDVTSVATPLPFTGTLPSVTVPLSVNVTLPVGSPVVFEATVAVNVID